MYTLAGVATVFLNLNGLINVATYYLQSRYAKQAILARMPARGQSFQVQFGGVTIADLDWSQSEAEAAEDVDGDLDSEVGSEERCRCGHALAACGACGEGWAQRQAKAFTEDTAGLSTFQSTHCSDA